MGIVRIRRHLDLFVILDRGCLNEPGLSFKAKGLWAYLMSLPDDWQVSIKDLQQRGRDGRDSIQSAMKELMDSGYVSRQRSQTTTGQMDGWDYTVYEVKEDKPSTPANDGNPVDGQPATTKEYTNQVNTQRAEKPKGVVPNTTGLVRRMANEYVSVMRGVAPYARLHRSVKGLSSFGWTDDQIVDGWCKYLRGTDSKWVSPENFASKAGTWVREDRKERVVDVADALGMGLG